jgi:hypothetical protein
MNNSTCSKNKMNWKKILAKEIIYFFSIAIVALIVFSIVEIRNHYLEIRSNEIKITQSINERKIDSLNKLILSKERKKQLIAALTKMINQGASDEDKKQYNIDYILRFGDKKKLEEINHVAKEQSKIKVEYLKAQNDFIRNDNQGVAAITVWILFILIYPVRLFFMLIIWSIRTVNHN